MKKRAILLLFIILIMGTGFGLIHAKGQKNVSREELRLKGKTIVIDPGHGGGDRGTKGKSLGTIEKDLNLKVAQNIKKELEERTDAKVILTREKDTSLLPETKQKEELQTRVKVAKDHSADLYISIHHDAFEDTNVKGITTHYGANKRKDKKLAKIVQEAIFEQNIDTRDRGIRKSDFLVLRENAAPAILIELGFTSNESDEKRMNSEEFQEKSKKGIVDGVITYFTV
ncbi:N-acetylmuramoyl-L-alanine amidase family protein [Bacillus thuringiensis]|uniref:N-acetylmuramoyl-L-alanine amidase family protein n=1 Tax=Bacillus thuringiensis TaxID=1428 RepID=UPI000BEC2232|nr:N-acetylmuramoyl-L-alanine amidase [Bacillus thuringiensis]MEC2260542.1 N-acetylmuramoyl-L-alanine amidase [Bacillus cereus]PEB73355.1 N-acetylmuramoyl-L-alanine amidase [Bacillus thuringiensis]PFB85815.1 N-acetylmuramoyl-L-alanine amidase [Bacillus thuringiensis]PGL73966.1 N-acetylmuramoyl-L-alanine amidase [Bacillus thuringiensis]PGN37138.1 N-acetylmuramoyl-L-alanine amidase [Bacillus thuringiensis]